MSDLKAYSVKEAAILLTDDRKSDKEKMVADNALRLQSHSPKLPKNRAIFHNIYYANDYSGFGISSASQLFRLT